MDMTKAFEAEKNRKAFTYTAIICGIILLLFLIIRWKVEPVTIPVIQDLIEINLGNNEEGFGEEQPLIKGNRTPAEETIAANKTPASANTVNEEVQPEDDAEKDAAPVTRPSKIPAKTTAVTPVTTPSPKPQKPKITYNGPQTGPPGNNPTEDNGFKNQGKNKKGPGDDGIPEGDKDSYGNTKGGKKGGPKIISGNRKIIRYYTFTGDLNKATIFAVIRVSPSGQGSYVRMVKPSTSFDPAYGRAISNYLSNIQFDNAPEESMVTVQFNFNVN